jgi:hypothetical protein
MPNYVLASIHSPIIPILLNLLQQDPSSSLSSLAFFSLHLPHPLGDSPIFVIWSSPLWPHITCPSYGHLFSAKGGLAQHQLSCTVHKESFVSRVVLPSTLPYSPPFLVCTWITSINIIDAFHLNLFHLHSYHHIPYVLRVD